MGMYYFIRSVPVLVGVEASNEADAWRLAGERVDDFMTDAINDIERVSHVDNSEYFLEYHGDAIYASQISPGDGSPPGSVLPQHGKS